MSNEMITILPYFDPFTTKYTIEEIEDRLTYGELDLKVWYIISKYQILTEEFIEKYSDKFDWYYISWRQKLSESFIEKHIDKVNWNTIVRHQSLSYSFLEKHLYRYSLNIGYGVNNVHLDKLRKKYPHKYQIDKLYYELNR